MGGDVPVHAVVQARLVSAGASPHLKAINRAMNATQRNTVRRPPYSLSAQRTSSMAACVHTRTLSSARVRMRVRAYVRVCERWLRKCVRVLCVCVCVCVCVNRPPPFKGGSRAVWSG